MFPGDGPAELDGQVHYLTVCMVRPLFLLFIHWVKDQQWMGVAVTSVGDYSDHDVMVLRDLLYSTDKFTEAWQRNADVLQQERTFLLDGGDSHAAGNDDCFGFFGVRSIEHFCGIVLGTQ